MTEEKRLYLQKVRALAERIANRAGVTKPKVAQPSFSDFLACKRIVFRKVFLPRGLSVIASVRVDEIEVYNPLNGGPESTPDELLPVEEARFAMVNFLMQRTPYMRPRLPR